MTQHKPQPHSTLESPMIIVENAFPSDFLLECLKYTDHLEEQQGKTGYLVTKTDTDGNTKDAGAENPELRQNIIKWIEPAQGQRAHAIWQQVDMVINQASREFFGFDTWVGGTEAIQYTEYNYNEEDEIKDHYDWHIDSALRTPMPFDRKVSFSLQLTSDDEYKGCDLQFNTGDMVEPNPIARQRGTLIMFPSFLTHRVTPITGGTRKALVGWCRGPKLR